jgi:hypothetical protein
VTPTERTLKAWRADGWTVAVVEKWNPHVRIRQDLFGFIDLIAIKAGCPITGIQVTASGASTRVAKIKEAPASLIWLLAGGNLEVHSWAKRGARGERKLYTCRRLLFELRDGVLLTVER